ncbi:YwaF family protein [Mycoplasmopsis columbinasalis]|uniref:Predicted integral membrane protein n=1 Tax=Mycoplasmopsis columbinasalis TaxID=114880 RepID=A0A449BAU9_9BACT|nr:YwaF family protein [Mycoplasmopsis columbinasalis]VEU78157.1 Predicted integral membrane protein [Mycoplasmopsis columbinasalis]
MTNFFNPYGNRLPLSGLSTIIYFSLVTLTVLSCVLLWFLKSSVKKQYSMHSTILGMRKITFWRVFGLLTIIFAMGRSVVLAVNDFPNLWEVIPLHLCRTAIFLIGIILIFNKLHWIKYFGSISLLGAFIAISYPGAGQNIGVDSFYFWDYYVAHTFLCLITSYLIIVVKAKYTFKDTIVTINIIFVYCVILFVINYITDISNSVPERWKANYLYLGLTQSKQDISFLAQILVWPYNFFIVTGVLIAYIPISILIWCLQNKLNIRLENKKLKISIRHSRTWRKYKKSMIHYWENHWITKLHRRRINKEASA